MKSRLIARAFTATPNSGDLRGLVAVTTQVPDGRKCWGRGPRPHRYPAGVALATASRGLHVAMCVQVAHQAAKGRHGGPQPDSDDRVQALARPLQRPDKILSHRALHKEFARRRQACVRRGYFVEPYCWTDEGKHLHQPKSVGPCPGWLQLGASRSWIVIPRGQRPVLHVLAAQA